MRAWTLDPLRDERWPGFVARHPLASVFHSRGWLEALWRTYGFQPRAVTTSPPDAPLDDALPFCIVGGLRGDRLVSLPFSDHCAPLVPDGSRLEVLAAHLVGEVAAGRARSVEARPPDGPDVPGMTRGAEYVLHTLDLSAPPGEIFQGFHPSSTRRAIRRAEREALRYERGNSDELLAVFYRLLTATRRRHGVPPPPVAWFRNLAACVGDALAIHVASKDDRPVAAILTLSSPGALVYKYGGSDASRHPLGGMPFLFWQAIQWAKEGGRVTLDLGRSDLDQLGLIAFKDHLGARRSTLVYYRHPAARPSGAGRGWAGRLARGVFSRLPDPLLALAGRLLYRHFA